MEEKDVYDTIVIGAGLSGLSAGLFLYDSNIKNILVLEARNRVGGRTCNDEIIFENPPPSWTKDRIYCDTGGAYVGPTQNRLLRLASRFNIKTFPVPIKGRAILEYNNKISHYTGTIPNCNVFVLLDLNHLLVETDRLADTINEKEPWSSLNANEYDQLTVAQWLDKTSWTKEARSHYEGALKTILAVQTNEVSLLYWLYYCKSGHGINRLIETDNGAQERKFIGGSQSISQSIFNLLNNDKKIVKLNHAVSNISMNDKNNIISVCCNNGNIFSTKYLIIAVPPALYQTIKFEPKLSWERIQLSQRMPMGCIIKTFTYFEKAFWRELDYSGFTFSNQGPIVATFDDTKPDGTFPCLMGFISGNDARNVSNLKYEDRKNLVIQQYYRMFKNKEALNVVKYVEKNWHEEEYSGGCYVGVMYPGTMTTMGSVLRNNEWNNRIHFGSTECATEWCGYMDGAIQSGERAAYNVGKLLLNDNINNTNTNIKLKIYSDIENEPNNCEIKTYPIGPTWVEKHLPSLKQFIYINIGLLGVIIGITYNRYLSK